MKANSWSLCKTVFLCFLTLSSFLLTSIALADDTDIYRSLYDIDKLGGKPQVMIIFDTSGSMEDVVEGEDGRPKRKIDIAKSVIVDLIENNPAVDFGLSIFNYNAREPNGGRIIAALPGDAQSMTASERKDLVNTIDALGPYTSTPLCETFYENYLYFSGFSPLYGTSDRASQCFLFWCSLVDENPPYTDSALKDGKYRSPLRPCEPTYIIYMTDGLPQYDADANSRIRSLVSKESFYSGCRRYSSADNNFSGEQNCMPELARYMNDPNTFSSEGVPKGPVITYTIGFDTDQKLLADTASPLNLKSSSDCPVDRQNSYYYGKNSCVGYFTANNADQLYQAFSAVVSDILSRSTTFSAPAVSAAFTDNTQSFDRLYLPRFLPRKKPRWSGNVKRLKLVGQQSWSDVKGREAFNQETGDIVETAYTWWSGSSGLDLEEPDGNAVEKGGMGGVLRKKVDEELKSSDGENDGRVIYTDVDGQLQPFEGGRGKAMTSEVLGMVGKNNNINASQLVAWARGKDIDDEDGDGLVNEARPWIMGDVLHSSPIALNYGDQGQGEEKLYVAFGTNAGFLHFMDGDSGAEKWAFSPRSLGELHKVLFENKEINASGDNLVHPYGVDGPPAYVRLDANRDGVITPGSGDRMLLAFGLRRGGSSYYAIDVTDPDKPKLAWEISPDGDFSELGQSWAAPIPTRVRGHDDPVFIISGGYDPKRDDPKRSADSPDAQGRAVYIVDAFTGKLVWHADPTKKSLFLGKAQFSHAIPASAEVVDYDSDGLADRLYLGDTAANLWRVDLTSESSDSWSVYQVAQLGGRGSDNRRFFNSVDFVKVSQSNEPLDLLLIGSGDRANPKSGLNESQNTSVQDAFFVVKDPLGDRLPTAENIGTPIKIGDLKEVTDAAFCSRTVSVNEVEGESCSSAWINREGGADANGWFISLENAYSLPLPGAKVLSESVTLNGITYFSAYVPSEPRSICVPVIGNSYLFALDLLTARSVSHRYEDGSIEKGERATAAGNYLLSRPSLVVRNDELFLQGLGSAVLSQLVDPEDVGNNGGISVPYQARRTYWYESEGE